MNDEIVLCDGKYRFYLDEDDFLRCSRYGNIWWEFTGDKAIFALFQECLELKRQLDKPKEKTNLEKALAQYPDPPNPKQTIVEFYAEYQTCLNLYGSVYVWNPRGKEYYIVSPLKVPCADQGGMTILTNDNEEKWIPIEQVTRTTKQ